MNHTPLIVLTASLLFSSLVTAQDATSTESKEPPTPRTPVPADEAERLLREGQDREPTVAEMRSKLRAREAEIRRLEEKIAELEAQNNELRIEKRGMEIALEIIRERPIIINVGEEKNKAQPRAELAEENDVKDMDPAGVPRWSIQYSLGLIDRNGNIRLVERMDDGTVSIRDARDVDRTHVMVRGNIRNESKLTYRYTFDARIAGRPLVTARNEKPPVIGEWRYQTPILEPGELHEFEIKVPVSHVTHVHRYEIGNISAEVVEDGDNADAGKADADDR